MTGSFPFVIHPSTGLVVSTKAIREAPQAVQDLLGSSPKTTPSIPINPSDPDRLLLVEALKIKRVEEAAAKGKSKKKSRGATAVVGVQKVTK